jgi:type IV pilus assembly protein PilC
MAKYNYRALNKNGRPSRGTLTAANEVDLFQQLQAGGFELIDCKEVGTKSGKFKIFGGGVKTRDKIQLFVHLEQLQKAGVPLLEGLADIRDTTESPKLRDIMTELHREVSEGASLSEAMSRHPSVFQNIFISLIAAGEETGNMMNSFTQVVNHLKWTDAMNSKVKKATRYPKILIGVVIIVVGIMMTKVVPQVTEFLGEIGQELPPVTLALIATSKFFTSYFLYIVIGLVAAYSGLKITRGLSESFLYYTDYIALRIPVMGPLIQKIALSRFCQTFGVLFTSGLEVLKCLDAASNTANNAVIREALNNVRENVKEGNPISKSLETTGEFPSMVVRMVKIGEESGNLTGVLNQVAEFYDQDVNEAVDAMIQMIEPALTVILGGMMLWIAAGVFGPIYSSFGDMGI